MEGKRWSVERHPVRPTAEVLREVRLRERCSLVILAIGFAVEISAIAYGIWWAWWVLLVLVAMSAQVRYNITVTFSRDKKP